MPFVPAPNVLKVSIEASLLGAEIVNTLHFQKQTGGAMTPQNVIDITNNVAAIWVDEMVPQLGGFYDYNRSVGTDISVEGGFQHTETAGSGAAGGFTSGVALANKEAFCLTLRTGFSGRSQRGRIYIAALQAGMLENPNTLSFAQAEAFRDSLGVVLQGIRTLTAEAWQPVVVSRFSNKQPRTVAQATIITSVGYSDRLIDSQERRKPGR